MFARQKLRPDVSSSVIRSAGGPSVDKSDEFVALKYRTSARKPTARPANAKMPPPRFQPNREDQTLTFASETLSVRAAAASTLVCIWIAPTPPEAYGWT